MYDHRNFSRANTTDLRRHRSFGLCRRLVGERVEVEERSASAKPTLMMHTTYERMAYVTRNRNRVSELKQLRGREELLKG